MMSLKSSSGRWKGLSRVEWGLEYLSKIINVIVSYIWKRTNADVFILSSNR